MQDETGSPSSDRQECKTGGRCATKDLVFRPSHPGEQSAEFNIGIAYPSYENYILDAHLSLRYCDHAKETLCLKNARNSQPKQNVP